MHEVGELEDRKENRGESGLGAGWGGGFWAGGALKMEREGSSERGMRDCL